MVRHLSTIMIVVSLHPGEQQWLKELPVPLQQRGLPTLQRQVHLRVLGAVGFRAVSRLGQNRGCGRPHTGVLSATKEEAKCVVQALMVLGAA